MTDLQSGRALLTCSVATQKHHIASPFHAYGAAVGFLNLSYFRLQIPEAFCAGLPWLAGNNTPICKNNRKIPGKVAEVSAVTYV